jgi:glutamine synthetase
MTNYLWQDEIGMPCS